jgi:hypothetical protein
MHPGYLFFLNNMVPPVLSVAILGQRLHDHICAGGGEQSTLRLYIALLLSNAVAALIQLCAVLVFLIRSIKVAEIHRYGILLVSTCSSSSNKSNLARLACRLNTLLHSFFYRKVSVVRRDFGSA